MSWMRCQALTIFGNYKYFQVPDENTPPGLLQKHFPRQYFPANEHPGLGCYAGAFTGWRSIRDWMARRILPIAGRSMRE